MIRKRIVKQFYSPTEQGDAPLTRQMQQEIDAQAERGYDLESWQVIFLGDDEMFGYTSCVLAVFIQVFS